MTTTAAQYRVSTTPNAVMTTYASPTQGSSALSLWRVEMTPGAAGPRHVVDSEQILTMVTGAAEVSLSGDIHRLAPGDTIVLPAHAERQLRAGSALVALVCGFGSARVTVPGEDADRGTPAWIG